MANLDLINEILRNKETFTKEEYEFINTYVVKSEAEYEKKRADKISETDPKYFVRRKFIEKYGELALKHKETLLNSALEEFNAHKEIALQCLSIMQSLVQNPNILDTLLNILDSSWYGNQDFKQFLANILQNEIEKLNQLHTELWNLRNTPLLFYLPELFDNENNITKLQAYNTYEERNNSAKNLIELLDKNYPLIP